MDAEQVRDAVRAAFDARADDYDASAMHRALAASAARFARVPEDGAAVDVATGTGLVARCLAERHPRLRLVGVDLSPGMLAVARAALPGAEWVQGDAEDLPIENGSADLVTCVTALHLFPDADRAISEFARILRPGGRLVTATFRSAGHGAGETHPYPRDHESFATLARLARRLTPRRLRIDRAAAWVRAGDRMLLAEAVRV